MSNSIGVGLINVSILQRKLNVPVTVALLRSSLVSINVTDQQLAKSLSTDLRLNRMSYATELIRECSTADPPVATQAHFAYTIDTLNQIFKAGKANDEFVTVFLLIFASILKVTQCYSSPR